MGEARHISASEIDPENSDREVTSAANEEKLAPRRGPANDANVMRRRFDDESALPWHIERSFNAHAPCASFETIPLPKCRMIRHNPRRAAF